MGLQDAVTNGRYLKNDDGPNFKDSISWEIPFLFNQNSYRDIEVQVTTYGLDVPAEDDLPEQLQRYGLNYLEGLSGHVLQNDAAVSLMHSFRSAVENAVRKNSAIGYLGGVYSTYVIPSPVQYSIGREFAGFPITLEAKPVGISDRSPIPSVPLNPVEVSFRKESTQRLLYRGIDNYSSTSYGVSLYPVGSFALGQLATNPLNQVPMESYTLPSAILRFDEQKVGQDPTIMIPTNNPLGYLSDTPLAFTTLESAHFLAQRDDFISAIRIRVSGVEQVNERAQAKIESVAHEIEEHTGLQVDITLGSSPQLVLVHIPGYQNLPGLGYVEEHWIRQLVGITIHRGVNKADLFFFASILISCCMYVISNATLNILSKRKEIGIFGALGWQPINIIGSLIKDAFVMSVLAIAVHFLLSGLFIVAGLAQYSLVRILLAIPLVLFVYLNGTVYTAWRAVAETPIDAIRGGQASSIASGSRLTRLISNSKHFIPAWLAMSLPVGAFIFVLAISSQLKGLMAGSFLGEYISIQVQPYHYALILIALLISGFCILESLLARLIERRSEIGLMKAVGWQRKTVFNHFIREGLTLSVIGGITGTTLGLGVFRGLYAAFPQDTLILLILGIVLPCFIGGLASIYPAYLATRLDPVDILYSK